MSIQVTFLCGLLMGTLSAILAKRRGKNPYFWFSIGFLFGLIGVIAMFFIPNREKEPAPILAQEPPALPKVEGPADKFWYYLAPSQESQGPMSLDALTRAFHQGKIDVTTYVWHEDLPEWRILKEFLNPA